MTRSYRHTDLKILFAYSGNRCAFPGCSHPIVADATGEDDAAVIGHIAHIVASSDTGPRADRTIPMSERDHHTNLILLCGHHHALVDSQESTYTVEDLRAWKAAAERRADDSCQQILDEARKVFASARKAVAAADWDSAVGAYDDAAELARTGSDTELEHRSRFGAARARIHYVMAGGGSDSPRGEIELLERASAELEAARSLGAPSGAVCASRAWIALLGDDVEGALRWSREASSAPDAEVADRADALIVRIQALLRLGEIETARTIITDEISTVLTEGDSQVKWGVGLTRLEFLATSRDLTTDAVIEFLDFVRASIDEDELAAVDVVPGLSRAISGMAASGFLDDARLIADCALDLAERTSDWSLVTVTSLQAAELAARCGDVRDVRAKLGRASSSCEAARRRGPSSDWPTLRATTAFGRGRALATVAHSPVGDPAARERLLQEAFEALVEARAFALDSHAGIAGDVEVFVADVSFWLGQIANDLGRPAEAASFFAEVRSDAAMAHERFATERGLEAWWNQIWSLRAAGSPLDASRHLDLLLETLDELPLDHGEPPRVATWRVRAREAREQLDRTDLALLRWFDSSDAHSIHGVVQETTLHDAVAAQIAPVISWCSAFGDDERSPRAAFLDVWGRGGFARVAEAIRAQPHRVIAVDATSIPEIRRWARMLCPLFETVLVKWKGDLGANLLLTPIPVDAPFGGHGYILSLGLVVGAPDAPNASHDWTVGFGWANPMPDDLVRFMMSEALPLVESGRLVIVPASLVGCTQTAVGWTDDLLVSGVLGGVVSAVTKRVDTRQPPTGQRVLDLSGIALPFIDNVSLPDLAEIVTECSSTLDSLRRVVLGWLAAGDLGWERWERISAFEIEIREACDALDADLQGIAKADRVGDWRVARAHGSFSAAERLATPPEQDPVTARLHGLASGLRPPADLAPWIPYWRLAGVGGSLNWACPLDNRSVPRDDDSDPASQTWLYPGTGGWIIPTVRQAES